MTLTQEPEKSKYESSLNDSSGSVYRANPDAFPESKTAAFCARFDEYCQRTLE